MDGDLAVFVLPATLPLPKTIIELDGSRRGRDAQQELVHTGSTHLSGVSRRR